MKESEAIEKLRAYHKCQRLQVKGIYEDCNEKLCDNCDLCYAQGNTGEHIESVKVAIQALEKQEKIKEAFEMWKAETDGYYGADDEITKFIRTLSQILRSDEDIYNNYETNKLV